MNKNKVKKLEFKIEFNVKEWIQEYIYQRVCVDLQELIEKYWWTNIDWVDYNRWECSIKE